MGTVIVSKKGWVVIPREIRERYGICPGDKVQVVDYAGSIGIVPVVKDPVRQMRGMFKDGPSLTEALMEERRKDKAREQRKLERWIARKE